MGTGKLLGQLDKRAGDTTTLADKLVGTVVLSCSAPLNVGL